MKQCHFSMFFIVLLFVCTTAYCDTVILKNGRQLEGKIVEETDTSIKIDIGFGAVGFEKEKVEKIQRSSDTELDKLEERLEEKRQESIKQAQENEQWYQQQERREELIDQRTAGAGAPDDRKDLIRQKREEIIRKRKEQLQRLRERRDQAKDDTAPDSSAGDSIPQPPPMPEPPAVEPPPPVDAGNVSAPEPEQLAPETTGEESSSSSGRRIHRLGEKSRRR